MSTVYVPVGLPGCGKTTFGNALAKVCQGGLLSMGADDVRESLYPGYSKGLVPFKDMDITYVFDQAYIWAEDILKNGYDLWWDAVNTNYAHRQILLNNVRDLADKVVALDFYVNFEIILERNRTQREGHRRPFRKTLNAMRSQRIHPRVSVAEGFDEVWHFKWQLNTTGDYWKWISTDYKSPDPDQSVALSPISSVGSIGWW